MKDSRYYFLLGFMSAILIAMFVISCAEPLSADICEPGSAEWCPMYVKVIQ